MYYCNGRYLTAQPLADGSYFLPYDDDFMYYDETKRQYILKDAAIKASTGENIDTLYEDQNSTQRKAEFIRQSNNVYRALKRSPYNMNNTDIVLFKIGRFEQGRTGIYNALVAQQEWVINFDKDLLEQGISENAKDDLRNAQLWHKGSYGYVPDPDQKDVGY